MPKGGLPPLPGWEDKFFAALRDTNLVFEACKRSGVSRAHVYRQRKADPDFAQRWADEAERNTELLEQIAVRRAAEGSDTLLIFLLKARRPDVYRENVRHDHSVVVDGQIQLALPEGTQPIEIPASKRREAVRALLAPDEEIEDAEVVHDTAA